MKRLAIALLFAAALPSRAPAQEQERTATAERPIALGEQSLGELMRQAPVEGSDGDVASMGETSPASLWGTFSEVIAWALVLVAGAGALLLVLKRYTPAGRMLNASGAVSIIGRTALSPRHTVFVLRVGGSKILIVGASGDRLVNLSEISESSEVVSFDAGFRAQLEREEAGSEERDADVFPYRAEIDKLRSVIRGWRGLMSKPYSKRAGDGAGSSTEMNA